MFKSCYGSDAKIELYESDDPLSLEDLIKERNKYLEERDYSEEAFESIGYWCKPFDEIYSFADKTNDKALAEKCIFSEHYHNNPKHKEFIKDNKLPYIGEYLMENRFEDISKMTELKTSLENNALISRLTSFSQPQHEMHLIRNKIRNNFDNSHEVGTLTKNLYKYHDRMEYIWNEYTKYGPTHGPTQQEIADELGITRHTVITDIRKYKQLHPEVIDPTQLYRQRHCGEEKTQKRIEWQSKICKMYKEGYSISKIAQKSPYSATTIQSILQEQGFNISLEDIKTTKELLTDYAHKGQFSTFDRNSLNENYLHMGSTAYNLDAAGAPRAKDNVFDRNALRGPILREARKNMAILRNNPQIIKEWEKQKGDVDKAKEILAGSTESEPEMSL